MLEQLLADMSDEYPVLGTVFVDERDVYLTYSLQQAACSNLQQMMLSGNYNISITQYIKIVFC